MPTPVVFNGVTYNIPLFNDVGYAQGQGNLSAYLIALANGPFPFVTTSPNPATAGAVRLAHSDTIQWRNNANSGNIALGVNTLDSLTFKGAVVTLASITTITGTGTITADASIANTFSTTVVGSLTLNGPINGTDGQKITFRLLQDGTGHSVTFSPGSGNFRFGTDIPSFTASGAGLTDYVGCIWNNAASRWDIVSVIQGF